MLRTYVLPCLLETVSSVKFTVSSVKFINLLTVDFLWLLCRCIALLVSWTGVHCFNEWV